MCKPYALCIKTTEFCIHKDRLGDLCSLDALKASSFIYRRKETQLVHLHHISACFQVRPKGKGFHFSQHIKAYSFVVIFLKVDFVKWSFLNFKDWIMVEIFLKV